MPHLLHIAPLLAALAGSGVAFTAVPLTSQAPASIELATIAPVGTTPDRRRLDVEIDHVSATDPAALGIRFVLQHGTERKVLAAAALFGADAASVERLRVALPEDYVVRPGDRLVIELDASRQPASPSEPRPSVRVRSVTWVPANTP